MKNILAAVIAFVAVSAGYAQTAPVQGRQLQCVVKNNGLGFVDMAITLTVVSNTKLDNIKVTMDDPSVKFNSDNSVADVGYKPKKPSRKDKNRFYLGHDGWADYHIYLPREMSSQQKFRGEIELKASDGGSSSYMSCAFAD